MTTKWSHLPNAKYIDLVLESLKAHPSKWAAGRNAAWNAARNAAWNAAWNAARDAAWNAAWDAAWNAAWDAIAALIAWDDCAYMLESDPDELALIAKFGDHRAILLLPACKAFNLIKSVA